MAAITEELGVPATHKPGSRGQYDVLVDGRKVIGKTFTGFPSNDEVVKAVREALGR